MKPEEIEKMVTKMDEKTRLISYEASRRKFNLYVNGGYEGLEIMYYNYMREQKLSFKETQPFEDYIFENDPKELFLDEIFFEVDNPYTTNIGVSVYSLCSLVNEDAVKSLESKKVEIFAVIKRLQQEIVKSTKCTIEENPQLYIVLKNIESYYRTIYSHIIEDFSPYINERVQTTTIPEKTGYIIPKETVAFKIGILFYTAEIIMIKGSPDEKFEYKGIRYSSGNSLAKILAPIINEKVNSIRPYINQTYNGGSDDKNVFFSTKLRKEIVEYCLVHQKPIHLPNNK